LKTALTSGAPAKPKAWNLALVVALVVVGVTAAVGWAIALNFYARLSSISPCDGGLGDSACPAAPGFEASQFGSGQLSKGTYSYQFLITPLAPWNLKASQLVLRIYNSSSNVTAAVSNVTLDSVNGSLMAPYSLHGAYWDTTSDVAIPQVAALQVSSSGSLSGERISIADTASGVTAFIPIR
jgi:hypothetical protein